MNGREHYLKIFGFVTRWKKENPPEQVFKILDEILKEYSIDWLRGNGISTDGARATTGKNCG
jgi:hypothetical protein